MEFIILDSYLRIGEIMDLCKSGDCKERKRKDFWS